MTPATLNPESHRRTGTAGLLLKLTVCAGVLLGVGWAAVAIARNFTRDDRPVGITHRITRGDLVVTVTEQGMLESAKNVEVKSKVRGWNTVLWIIESGSFVKEGDELVRLDSFPLQEQIDERTKYANWSQSAADRSKASVAAATIAIPEYSEGRYRAQVMELEKDVAVAEASLRNAKDRLSHVRTMANSGYISELEIEEADFAVRQFRRSLDLNNTELDVLRKFTHKEQMQTLEGNLNSITANHKANAERAMADTSRRDRAVEELQYCVIRAEHSGLVIHPNAAKWESGPIAEGTNVHTDQLLLLMPDLDTMQVKVGVHESIVKRVKNGQSARVVMAEGTLDGQVTDVASVTKPAGWWTANQVRYDTLVSLPPSNWLRPGMSADVEIAIAEHSDVLLIPVAAIVDREDATFCWVLTDTKPERRSIRIGDTNDVFSIVEQGLSEGDDVLLNPFAYEAPIAKSKNRESADDEESKTQETKTETP